MAKIKVACIGHPALHEFLQGEFSQWDWQDPIETIQDFYVALNDGEIDINTRAIFIYDGLFDPHGEDKSFEVAVARFAPFALVAILNYKKDQNGSVQKAVSDAAAENGWAEEPYWFIDYKHPLESIDKTIEEAIRNHSSDEVVEAFSSGNPIISIEESEKDVSNDDDDYDGPVYDSNSIAGSSEKVGKVIAVTSSKGGSGKSTVAVSLGSYIARSSKQAKKDGLEKDELSVAIVDLDVRDGQLGFVTGVSKPTVLSLAIKEEISTETVKSVAIENEELGCDLFLAPKSPRASEETPPQLYRELITALRAMYDYVILDTSVNYLDPLLEEVAYPNSDQIIFVTDLGVNSVFGMTRWLREVTGEGIGGNKGMGINKNKIGIVVNKTMPHVGMTPDKIKKAAMGRPVLTNLPSMPTMVTAAANSKRLQDLTRQREFNQYIRMLSKAVVGKGYNLAHIQ